MVFLFLSFSSSFPPELGVAHGGVESWFFDTVIFFGIWLDGDVGLVS